MGYWSGAGLYGISTVDVISWCDVRVWLPRVGRACVCVYVCVRGCECMCRWGRGSDARGPGVQPCIISTRARGRTRAHCDLPVHAYTCACVFARTRTRVRAQTQEPTVGEHALTCCGQACVQVFLHSVVVGAAVGGDAQHVSCHDPSRLAQQRETPTGSGCRVEGLVLGFRV